MQVPPGYSAYPRPQIQNKRRLRPGVPLTFDPIGRAWQLLLSDIGTWLSITLVILVVSLALSVPLGLLNSAGNIPFGAGPRPHKISFVSMAVHSGLGVFISVPAYILSAGITRVVLLKNRGVAASFTEAFGWNGMAGQLALASLLISLAQTVIQVAFVIPLYASTGLLRDASFDQIFNPITIGVFAVTAIAAWYATASLMFVPAILIDQKLPAADAIRQSFTSLGRQPLVAMCFILASHVIAGSGVIACCVGFFLTAGFPYIAYGVAYHSMCYELPTDAAPLASVGYSPPGFEV